MCGLVAVGAASCRGREDSAKRELERRGIDLSRQAFLAAVRRDNREEVRLFIEAGIMPVGALLEAAKEGRCEALAGLLEGGLEVTGANGAEALLLAIGKSHRICAERLQASGADFNGRNIYGETFLLRSARRKSTRQLRKLLAHGADPSLASWTGETPLMAAAGSGRKRSVVLLFAAGADPEATDQDGWTALLFAVRDGHRGSARRLLAAGADVNVVSELGWTPLMWAAREGRTALVADLVAAGAEIDLATKAGRTALVQAAAQGHAEVVQQLLEAGARPDLIVEGVDARRWASTGGWPEIEDLLAQAAGSVRE